MNKIYTMPLFTTILFMNFSAFNVFAQNDTTVTLPKELWKKYFMNASDSGHSAIADRAAFYNQVIATDRPDQCESAYLVPKGTLQWEGGAWYSKGSISDTIKFLSNVYNTSLFRLGLSNNIELRLNADYTGLKLWDKKNSHLIGNYNGISTFSVGTKLFICDEKGLKPQMSMILHLTLPYAIQKYYRPAYLSSYFKFLFQHTISDRFALNYNLGMQWNGTDKNATSFYTLSLAINLVPKLAMYIESYGFFTENSSQRDNFDGSFTVDERMDGGFTYLLKNNVQLDCSGGIGLSKISPDYFLSVGLSIRIPR